MLTKLDPYTLHKKDEVYKKYNKWHLGKEDRV